MKLIIVNVQIYLTEMRSKPPKHSEHNNPLETKS